MFLLDRWIRCETGFEEKYIVSSKEKKKKNKSFWNYVDQKTYDYQEMFFLEAK